MKKSVMLMAGLLTVALAGSAQAAGNTMFAVQNTDGTQDMAAITDTGDVNAVGTMTVGGRFGVGLSKAPVGPLGQTMTAPFGVFHVAAETNAGPNAAFLAQISTLPTTAGGSTFGAAIAPSFSFYRINRYDATNPVTALQNTYLLPLADNSLGYFQFGSVNSATDPNLGSSKKNAAFFYVKAENTWTSLTDTTTYFSWQNANTGGALTERMRLSAQGNLGIGTTGTPTSKLQVVGLQVSDSGPPAGLTSGAFYRTTAGVVMVVP